MSDILDGAIKLIELIANGIGNFIDFILGLPTFIYNLIEVVPEPLYSVLLSFISIIIFLILLLALGKVISSVK